MHSPSATPPVEPSKTSTPTPIQVSEVPDYRTKYIFSGHRRSISTVKFNPAGTILASAGECIVASCLLLTQRRVRKLAADKTIKLWDLDTAELIKTLEGHAEGISDVAWSSDGDYLASASDDKEIWIWSIETVSRCCTSKL